MEKFSAEQYLGKGVDKLAASSGREEVLDIPIDKIRPNPYQPRKDFDREKLRELADSIKAKGLVEPIIVRATDDPESEHVFELVAGERRWRASKMAGLPAVKAIVRKVSERDSKTIALLENLQREDLNPFEKMMAISALKEELNESSKIAEEIGIDRRSINLYLRFHGEITSVPGLLDILSGRSKEIRFPELEKLASIGGDLRRIEKSRKREFARALKALSNRNRDFKETVTRLQNRIELEKRDLPGEAALKPVFKETGRTFGISVTLKKDVPITSEEKERILGEVSQFTDMLSSLPSQAGGER